MLEFRWTQEMDADLLQMKNDGMAFSQIHEVLSRKYQREISRCAAIGRASRLKKQGVKVRDSRTRASYTSNFTADIRSPKSCQWPTGDGPFYFECNEPAKAGRPYCDCHCGRAYVPRKPEFDRMFK